MMIKCSCCGHVYEDSDNLISYSVCPKCYWEEDMSITNENDYSAPNHHSLSEYRDLFNKEEEDNK